MAAPLDLSDLDLSSLKGKSILVTGGASGLGLQTAQQLAKAGAYVTVADLQPTNSTIESFKSQSLAVQYVRCDVTDWSQQVVAFKQAINFGPSRSLDHVCCFAGVNKQGPLLQEVMKTEPTIDDDPHPPCLDEIEINLKGMVYSTKLALHYFRLRGRTVKKTKPRPASHSSSTSESEADENKGESKEIKATESKTKVEPTTVSQPAATKSLTIVSSMAGYKADAYNTMYTASKFGTRGLFLSINQQVRDMLNVRVNLIAPWVIVTPMTRPLIQAMEKMGLLQQENVQEEQPIKETPEVKSKEETQSEVKDDVTEAIKEDEAQLHAVDEGTTSNQPATVDGPLGAAQANQTTEVSQDTIETTSEEATTDPISTDETPKEESSEEKTDKPTPATSTPDETIIQTQTQESEQQPKYKGVTFAQSTQVSNTTIKCIIDPTISGRAFAIMPEGVFDLGDDNAGGYAGEMVKTLLGRRKEDGDVISG